MFPVSDDHSFAQAQPGARAQTQPRAAARPREGRRSVLLSGLAAIFFGGFLVAGAGFAGPDALHEAAHDARHAMGFPCH